MQDLFINMGYFSTRVMPTHFPLGQNYSLVVLLNKKGCPAKPTKLSLNRQFWHNPINHILNLIMNL